MNAEITAAERLDTAATELKRHVSDAAIAAQLSPPHAAQFLAKFEKVRSAQETMRLQASYAGD